MRGRLSSGTASGRTRRRERGAVAVEFGLVMLVLIPLLVGTVTAGIEYSRAMGLTNAVREGARFGATADISSASWASDVIARTRQMQFDDGSDAASSTTSVCVELRGSTTLLECETGALGIPAAPVFEEPAPTTAGGNCVVLVYAARSYAIVTGMAPSLTGAIQRQAAARYEGTC
jgi:Flp pilus assembly protein TadG